MQSPPGALDARGMRRVFRELGTPADTLDVRFVNGFMYTRLRPLIRPDKPATKLPPLSLLKVAVAAAPRDAPTGPKRRRARCVSRPWRAGHRRLGDDGPALDRAGEPGAAGRRSAALDDDALLAHVDRASIDHCPSMWELHFWLHGYDLGPIGLLLSGASRWGLPICSDVIELLEGASPSTSEPPAVLAGIRAAVEAAGHDPATLDDVRRDLARGRRRPRPLPALPRRGAVLALRHRRRDARRGARRRAGDDHGQRGPREPSDHVGGAHRTRPGRRCPRPIGRVRRAA